MRLFTLSMLTAIALFRSCSSGGVQPIEQSSAERFRNAIGVNVHLQYSSTRYRDAKQVAQALDYLGISHVRDGALRRGDEAFDSYLDLARHGIGFDLFFNMDLLPQLRRVTRLGQAEPGAIDLLEGPNEVNNDPVTYAGRTGVAGARAYQAALYAMAKADPTLAAAPILNYTNWPPTGGRSDAVNAHTYGRPGVDTQTQISTDVALAAASLPNGLPRYITETGYPTAVAQRSAPWVSPHDQASLTLIALLDAYRSGVRRTYLYELFDEGAFDDENSEAHYGLFDHSGVPKPAAIALHAVMSGLTQLQQTRSFVPPDFRVHVTGWKSLLLRAKSGGALLFVWRSTKVASRLKISMSQPEQVRQVPLDGTEPPPDTIRQTWSDPTTAMLHVFLLSPVQTHRRPLYQ